MKHMLNDVESFMLVCGQEVRNFPATTLPRTEAMLRMRLLAEEFAELREAIGLDLQSKLPPRHTPDVVHVDKVAALDALTDILYVLLGTYHTLGLGHLAVRAFIEVQRSNMSKCTNGQIVRNAEGKILKGPNYSAPDLKALF